MRSWLSQFSPRFPEAIAYMLQNVEYEVRPYLAWLHRVEDFRAVMSRRNLDNTAVAKSFTWFIRIGIIAQVLIGCYVAFMHALVSQWHWVLFGLLIVMFAPILWAYLVLFPLVVARRFVIVPRQQRYRRDTKATLESHPGVKIAVAGSYGKTTMKELLLTVLSEGKKVAATPANKNVASAHYSFAKKLDGDEDVIVVEFGEGKPGDVESFTETVQPDIGVITGLAPAHLDQYGTFQAAARDIFSLAEYMDDNKPLYVNSDSENIQPYLEPEYITYSSAGLKGWKTSDVAVGIDGTTFKLNRDGQTLKLHSGLLGRHLVGVLSATAIIALELGLSPKQVEAGIAKTVPYEHRMKPYPLSGGWVIDDAYNGNIEGIKAGTELLGELEAGRKIYVTPGLVDQGEETEQVHVQAGKLIAGAKPDLVVLMNNSVTEYIQRGLAEAGYKGEVRVEHHPLQFYTGLDQFLAAGDVCMLQNDWTDNYA